MTAPDVAEIARGLTKAQLEALPKAGFSFRYRSGGSPLYIKTRGANFAAVWFWRFEASWPMPWIPSVARTLYPHHFEEANHD